MNALTPLLCFALACSTAAAAASDTLVIDNFDYADSAAAQAAWTPRANLPPVAMVAVKGRGAAMRIELPFKSMPVDRSYVDRNVKLDLSAYSEISLDVFAESPNPAGRITLYFRSGAGWYGKSFGLRKGWNTVVLSKGDFGAEDSPAGWHAIDGIRISPWRGQKLDGYCMVDNLRARAHEFAVVAGAAAAAKSHDRGVQQYATQVVAMLREAGLSAGAIDDFDVVRGALKHAKVALFPYNPVLAKGEAEAVREFVDAGGKIMVFYSLPEDMADLLGVENVGWAKRERPGEFAEIRFDAPDIIGLPKSVKQASWNITLAAPAGRNARVIGYWFDDQGADTTRPAVIMSDTGVFMSHVILADDPAKKKQMLLAWLGHYVPKLWPQAAQRAIDSAGAVGPMKKMADLDRFILAHADAFATGPQAKQALVQTRTWHDKAQALADAGKYVEAIAAATRANREASRAYAFCHKPRTCEFRALWNHSGTGAFPGDWDKSMANLKKGGFNAIVPNMWWAGVAHYDSAYLPKSKTFEKYGDQIAQCVAAGKRYGIEVHPWKVNWNLSNAPQSFVDKMRDEGRLQVDPSGKAIKWLCPSNPKNFELELNTMVEVAQKYDVDGVHFDYIRYPGRRGCYCDGCRERFEKELGRKVENWPKDVYDGALRKQYTDFRCAQISRLVKAVSERVREIKPYCKISAAVFNSYPNCRDSVGQDWVLWCKKGWLDFVCPMNYIQEDEPFAQRVSAQLGYVGGAVPLYSGVGVTLRWRHTPEQAISQIELAREAGADGIIVFNYSEALTGRFMDALGSGIFSQPAIQPHQAPDVAFDIPGQRKDVPHFLFVPGESGDVSAVVAGLGRHRKLATGVQARLRLENTAGDVLEEFGAVNRVGQKVQARVAKREGKLRLALAGVLIFADGRRQSFVARSYPFVFGE